MKTAFSPEQTGELDDRVGAEGFELTVTVAVKLKEVLQEPLLTLVKFKVVLELTLLIVTSTSPSDSIVTVPLAAPE